jgi:hypothetical protein
MGTKPRVQHALCDFARTLQTIDDWTTQKIDLKTQFDGP